MNASRSNDLLLQRLEDTVGGEVGKRFSQSLIRRLDRGEYEPEPVTIVPVPKPEGTTRPAALMTLEDRVVYDALVAALRPRIETSLLGRDLVFWPRGEEVPPRWAEFESAPLADQPAYVVRADVAGYYESIPHDTLAETLVVATGRREIIDALVEFLGRVMRSSRGLPQGLATSDALATAYLGPVDRAMVVPGYHYYRHGDDFRIAVKDFPSGREAVARLEATLRSRGLMLNGAKHRILRERTYRDQLGVVNQAREDLRRHLTERRVAAIYGGDQDGRVEEMLEEAGLEEFLWGMYHGTVDIEEIIEALRPRLEASDVDVAAAMFRAAMSRAPGTAEALPRETFHQQLTASLTILTASRDPAALAECSWLLTRFPDETQAIGHYLAALAPSHPAPVMHALESTLLRPGFRHGWQDAWLFRLARSHSELLSETAVQFVEHAAGEEARDWFSRMEAVRLLARLGRLDGRTAVRLWSLAPAVFRADLVAAAWESPRSADWVADFLEGCRGNPVHDVVLAHLEQRIPAGEPGA